MSTLRKHGRKALCTLVAIAFLALPSLPANAAINHVSVSLDNPLPSATGASYTWQWSGYQTASADYCVLVKFSALADGSGGIPTGMAFVSPTLTGTFGGTWTADVTNAATGVLAFNWASGVTPSAGPSTLIVGGVTNSSTAAGVTGFETITTYSATGSSGACGGSIRDAATVAAWETTTGQAASVTIDPSLTFTITPLAALSACGDISSTSVTSTSNIVNLGHIYANSQHPTGGQTLNVTTNANAGYTVYISYSGAMVGPATSHTFAQIGAPNSAPIVWPANGTEAFGYTTASSTLTGTAARFHTLKFAGLSSTPSEIMYNSATPGTSGDNNCVGFEASQAGNSPADTYTAIVRYNAVASF